jgi:hypothetical protein
MNCCCRYDDNSFICTAEADECFYYKDKIETVVDDNRDVIIFKSCKYENNGFCNSNVACNEAM